VYHYLLHCKSNGFTEANENAYAQMYDHVCQQAGVSKLKLTQIERIGREFNAHQFISLSGLARSRFYSLEQSRIWLTAVMRGQVFCVLRSPHKAQFWPSFDGDLFISTITPIQELAPFAEHLGLIFEPFEYSPFTSIREYY